MIITRLKLENWRNFTFVDIPLRERAFVIGPNASGKSNLLDAIRFLRDVAKRDGGGAVCANCAASPPTAVPGCALKST